MAPVIKARRGGSSDPRALRELDSMKRLTVAAAAFAAGMLIIVAQSQAESDHHMLGSVARVTAKDQSAGRAEARTADTGADKRKAGQNSGTTKGPRTTTASLQG